MQVKCIENSDKIKKKKAIELFCEYNVNKLLWILWYLPMWLY